MDKLYAVNKTEYTKDVDKIFINLYIVPDEKLILYFNNSPHYKLIRVHGIEGECNYYGTVDTLNCNCPGITVISIHLPVSLLSSSCEYVSFPLADIKHIHCDDEEDTCENSGFIHSNNPAQGYYDSYKRDFVFPAAKSKKPDTVHDVIFKYFEENGSSSGNSEQQEQTCGKNGTCDISVPQHEEPPLYTIDDITPVPHCDTVVLVEHFTMDDTEDINDGGGCPCKKKLLEKDDDVSITKLVFFNKNKLYIYFGVLLTLILILCFLCFSRFKKM